ncbi:MAG: DUF2452 domain-containing protein [Candidatus Nanopelagicus sp.]
MDIGAPKFDLVPVTKQKDIMLNVARTYAQQEYDRIMELVSVLQKQADQIKRRLDITDMVHASEYQFQLFIGNVYWLAYNIRLKKNILIMQGPNDWITGTPEDYEYVAQVRWMGDHTWMEVE